MNKKLFCHLLGRQALVMAVALLIPLICALVQAEGYVMWLILPPIVMGLAGWITYKAGRHHKERILIPEAAVYILFSWLLLAITGMLPYMFGGELSPVDAFLQATSDATNTGLILFSPLAPDYVYVWHSVLGWLGGANFLLLLVTMIPLASGCFGLLLSFRRGIGFSPMLGQMKEVGKQVLGVYAGLTVLAACLYFAAGLPGGSALEVAMLTVSTTGGDLGHYIGGMPTAPLKIALFIVMWLTCGNIWRYWRTFRRRDWQDYYDNREIRVLIRIVLIFSGLLILHLLWTGQYSLLDDVPFYIVSYVATTGIIMPDTPPWQDFELFLLILLALMGGTIGSPTGGLKTLRFIALIKLIGAEIKRTLHPHMLTGVIVGGQAVPADTAGRILAFFFMYCCSIFAFVLMLALNDLSLSAAVEIAVSTFTGLGSAGGLCDTSAFNSLTTWGKCGASLFMIVGRVEIFTCLLIPEYLLRRKEKQW